MNRFFVAGAALALVFETSTAFADCRAIADPTARLACYDQSRDAQAAQAPVNRQPARPLPTAPVAPTDAEGTKALKHRVGFDSRIVAISPLRHGYYRMVLVDGTAYETTATGAPPSADTPVRIRRTFIGTTYFDAEGASPIAVKLSRRQ